MYFFFFFSSRRRHTRSLCDWSSDVCSSDLCATAQPVQNVTQTSIVTNKANPTSDDVRQAIVRAGTGLGWQMRAENPGHMTGKIGRASCRERVEKWEDDGSIKKKRRENRSVY